MLDTILTLLLATKHRALKSMSYSVSSPQTNSYRKINHSV